MRKVLGIIIIICGSSVVALGVFLVPLSHTFGDTLRSIGIAFAGILIVIAGWEVIRKRRVRDIMESLFLGWP